MNGTVRPPLDTYGQPDHSPLLVWLPIVLGLFASAIVAFVFCPVPRAQTLAPSQALFLAGACVAGTIGAGTVVLLAGAGFIARRGLGVSIVEILPVFGGVAAWITPTFAFCLRDSLWAVPAAFVLAVLGARLVYLYPGAIRRDELSAPGAEHSPTEPAQNPRFKWVTFASFLLQFAALFVMAEMAGPAAVLLGCATLVISCFYQTTLASDQTRSPSTSLAVARPAMTIIFAILLVVASLTPYLALPGDDANSADAAATTHRSTAKRAGPKASLLELATAFLRRLLGEDLKPGRRQAHAGTPRGDRPYPALQAIFGERERPPESEPIPHQKRVVARKSIALVPADVSPGVLLRPKLQDSVAIVPPSPRHWAFDGKSTPRRADQFSIPFDGAYWFFRAADQTLPADAIELRGDPASTSFKTTDFTPMSMEARQNFGSVIDLSCCRAIELVISNGDRRPGTVAVELILTDTRMPGQPSQSVGISPVNSTRRWFPGDERPPVRETLIFRLPAQSAIQSFDEVIVRFDLQFPREPWSAKIAIESFRLIPRGL